ncbi:MAG: FKBP-type peptidyl-prolyl cis-trans isomerase [Bacteroidales bacterium]|nr:FKBP-type peptidyl-prolyl cis-trans isomerase [Bacteroidales bacterium]
MKKILITAVTLLITTTLISQNRNTMTNEQKVSYIVGHNWGRMMYMEREHFNFDFETIVQAMKDARDGKTSLFTDEEVREIMQEFELGLQQSRLDQAKAEGRAFLEANRRNAGVQVTESGLQYRVVTMGTGPRPAATDRVNVHYEGTLLDGTVFDSSFQRGQPITFGLNQVITGWTEGVQLMPVGSRFVFYIPSDLAYGDRGMPPTIPAGATLIFTVELIGIE